MKNLIVLPPTFNHQWESLRMKLDAALDQLQEMVMDSHLKAAKQWCDEVAASMTKIKLRTDVNRQFRNAEFYPPEPEVEPLVDTFEIRAPWVEELLRQTGQPLDSDLKAELETQKRKQQVLEEKFDAMAAEQKLMKEQQAELIQNQVQENSKMDTMLEILMNMQKKP